MSRLVWTIGLILGLAANFACAARAQTSADAALPRITGQIDETQTVTVPTAKRFAVANAVDQGALPPNQVIEHIQLALSRDAASEKRAEDFVASQYDPSSTAYHKWITADEFRARFGVAQADIDKVAGWLTARGFSINSVRPGGFVVDFTGAADQVSRAFHTELRRFLVNGAPHIANVSEPAIPAALSPVVVGVVALNDVRPKPRYHRRVVAKDTDGQGDFAVAPADLATIYNFNAAFKAGYTGAGQTIAVVEDTDLYHDNADWVTFRNTFGLNVYTGGSLSTLHPAPKNGAACADPGINSDDVEAALDVQWASAAAPNAKIVMASCNQAGLTDGVTLAIENLVDSLTPPPIISVSYGNCEAQNGAAGNAVYNTYYQLAAAQGISVFVATGDNGPSDCALDGDDGAKYGIGANGWATTAYNVAVGGTDFSDTAAKHGSTYWKSTNSLLYGSAKSYVPEIPWNDTCASQLIATSNGYTATFGAKGFCNVSAGTDYLVLGGGEGAPSGCATGAPSTDSVVSGTCKGWPKPSWQKGVLGIPADKARDIPDVSLFAADGIWNHYYVSCYSDVANGGGLCTGDPASWAGGGGGTSYATPIWAGIQALINGKTGAKQGNPAPTLYKLAAAEFGATGDPACYADLGNRISAKCVFYNVTTSSDVSDCVKGSPDCYAPSGTYGALSTSKTADKPAYNAHAGYNLPTGLGTVNVFNLLAKWP